MRKSRYTDEEICAALEQAEAGVSISSIIAHLGVSEATFYAWKKRFGDIAAHKMSELDQLRDENAYLRRLVARLTLERRQPHDMLVEK